MIVSCRCSVDHLCQLASTSVHSFSKYRVDKSGMGGRTDGWTKGQVKNIMPRRASLAWRRHDNEPQRQHQWQIHITYWLAGHEDCILIVTYNLFFIPFNAHSSLDPLTLQWAHRNVQQQTIIQSKMMTGKISSRMTICVLWLQMYFALLDFFLHYLHFIFLVFIAQLFIINLNWPLICGMWTTKTDVSRSELCPHPLCTKRTNY